MVQVPKLFDEWAVQCIHKMGSSKCLASAEPQLWAQGEEGTPIWLCPSGPLKDQNVVS